MCASTRAKFWLRGVELELTESFAKQTFHAWGAVARDLEGLCCLVVASHSLVAVLPRRASGAGPVGRFGQTGCDLSANAIMSDGLGKGTDLCFRVARSCVLSEAGCDIPSWAILQKVTRSCLPQNPTPTNLRQGGSGKREKIPREVPPSELVASVSDVEKAMMHSQHGPLASSALTNRVTRFEAQLSLILLCRRFRLPFFFVVTHLPIWRPIRFAWPS